MSAIRSAQRSLLTKRFVRSYATEPVCTKEAIKDFFEILVQPHAQGRGRRGRGARVIRVC